MYKATRVSVAHLRQASQNTRSFPCSSGIGVLKIRKINSSENQSNNYSLEKIPHLHCKLSPNRFYKMLMLEFSVHWYIISFLVLLIINLGFLLMKEPRMELLSRVTLMVYKDHKHMTLPIPFNVFLETFA